MSTREERARAMAAVRHSTALEGREVSGPARELQDRWVAGELDSDELLAQTAALYDVDVDQADQAEPAEPGPSGPLAPSSDHTK